MPENLRRTFSAVSIGQNNEAERIIMTRLESIKRLLRRWFTSIPFFVLLSLILGFAIAIPVIPKPEIATITISGEIYDQAYADDILDMLSYAGANRNIFVAEFKENEITKGLEKITLYTVGSVSSAESGIAFVDENTFSSLVETRKGLSPIALAQESKVLAIYDLTFMTEPHNGILDNNQLISNIADWLMSPGEKTKS